MFLLWAPPPLSPTPFMASPFFVVFLVIFFSCIFFKLYFFSFFFCFSVFFLTYKLEHFNNSRLTIPRNMHYWSSGSALAFSFI